MKACFGIRSKKQKRNQNQPTLLQARKFKRSEGNRSSTRDQVITTTINQNNDIVNPTTSPFYRRRITEPAHETKPIPAPKQIPKNKDHSRQNELNLPSIVSPRTSERTTTASDVFGNHTNALPSKSEGSNRTTVHGSSSKPKLPPIATALSSTRSDQRRTSPDNSNCLPTRRTPGLCGLTNIGNTCFMNSAIQCLSSIPHLTKWVMKQPTPLSEKNVIDIYISLVQSMWSGRNACVNPRKLKDIISQSAPIFADYGQNDSHEFMNTLLNAIQNVDPDSFIVNLFRINTESKTICKKKKHADTTEEITTFLPLPLPESKSHDHKKIFLEDLIDDFCQEDDLTGEYYCQQCDVCLSARQKTSIIQPLPPVLIIQLKRFPFDDTGRKLNTLVQYKLEHRNLLSKNDKYTLCAVSMHSGSLSGGHYTTVARNHQTEKWYRFNDSYVEEIDSKDVLDSLHTPQAYILVYLKENIGEIVDH